MAWAQKLIGHKWVSNLGNDTKKSTKVHYILCLMLILGEDLLGSKYIKIVSWPEQFGTLQSC